MNCFETIKHFAINGDIVDCYPFGNGHINDTFRLVNNDPNAPDYLLQRVNSNVFKDIAGLMSNIGHVTAHIRRKLIEKNCKNYHERVLTLIHTHDGQLYCKNSDGYWRVLEFMKHLKSYEHVGTTAQAYEGAKAFGQFLNDLSDFPTNKLNTTIPDFHDLGIRMKQFQVALERADPVRSIEAKKEIKYVHEKADGLLVINDLSAKNQVPIRATHNDTKFNNVLLDENDIGKCVVDLDTVMPGLVFYDFGDGIRTGAVTSEEDEPDLSKVDIDESRFEAFTAGYLDTTREVLTTNEIKYLPLAGAFMAFIMGVRFLTDHLNGDKYYKISFPGHNLQRAKCQLHLSKIMIERIDTLENIVKNQAEVKKRTS